MQPSRGFCALTRLPIRFSPAVSVPLRAAHTSPPQSAFFHPPKLASTPPIPARPRSAPFDASRSALFLAQTPSNPSLTSLFRYAFLPFSKPPVATFSTHSANSAHRPSYYGQPARRPILPSRGNGSFRQQFDRLPQAYILYALIAGNVVIYAIWQYAYATYERFRDPSWVLRMRDNFTVSWRNVTSGRFWTLITATMSHERGGHILLNLMSLYFMAPPVLYMLGNTGFMALYLFSGLAASSFSLLFNHFVAPKTPMSASYSSHGASGAIYGILAFFAATNPHATFLVMFIVPAPAWLCVGGLFTWDIISSFRGSSGMTDSAGHIGGALGGMLWFMRKVGRF